MRKQVIKVSSLRVWDVRKRSRDWKVREDSSLSKENRVMALNTTSESPPSRLRERLRRGRRAGRVLPSSPLDSVTVALTTSLQLWFLRPDKTGPVTVLSCMEEGLLRPPPSLRNCARLVSGCWRRGIISFSLSTEKLPTLQQITAEPWSCNQA